MIQLKYSLISLLLTVLIINTSFLNRFQYHFIDLNRLDYEASKYNISSILRGGGVLRLSGEFSGISAKSTIPEKPKPKAFKFGGKKFKRKLAFLESGGNYNAVNRYGYIGKYQFSKKTLKGLIKTGYLNLSPEELHRFKHYPKAQERAIDALISHNKEILLNKYHLKKYVGETVGGVKITLDGMLAGAHLLGPYAVKHYLITGGSLNPVKVGGVLVRKVDGNGTSIKTYMKKFSYG
jgi:hypothetical protein